MPIDFNLLKTFAEHSRDVNAVAFSPNDQLLASGGGDRTVRILRIESYELLHTMDHGEWVNDVAFAPSGQAVASAARDGSVKLWNVETGQLFGTIQAHPQNATCLTFSRDGSRLLSAGAEGAIRVFNLKERKSEGGVNAHKGWVWRVGFSSAGNRVVSAGADWIARVWRLGGAEKPVVLEGHPDEVLYASFSPDDRLVATAGKEGTLRIWESETARLCRSIDAHLGAANAVNFSPDGVYIVSAGADHYVRVWRVEDGELLRELAAGYDYIAEAVFSRDGKRLASCGGDGSVKLWELTDKAAYASTSVDPELEIVLEEPIARSAGYSSAYTSGKTIAECALSTGLKVTLLQSAADKHSLAIGTPPRNAVNIAGDELTLFNADGIVQFKLSLIDFSIAYDSTDGAAKPWVEDAAEAASQPASVNGNSADVSQPVVAAAGGVEFELSETPAFSRYQVFEKLGESIVRERGAKGRLIRLVRSQNKTVYVLFDEQDDPTLVLSGEDLDVMDSAKKPVFRLNLRRLEPVISRRDAAGGNGHLEEVEFARDPLLATKDEEVSGAVQAGYRLNRILATSVWAKASDIHVTAGAPVLVRRHGRLERFEDRLYSAEEAEAILLEILTEEQLKTFQETNDLDFSYEISGTGRFRANLHRQHRGIGGSFRVIPSNIPTPEMLGLPESVLPMSKHHQGLVLVTGPAGQGKSTTIATLVDLINSEKPVHIITVEDPIEFVHPIKHAVVNQREVGKHTRSFANALRAALREDPDVIVVGEMRDLETISLAITAAETGHLVFGTLMTTNASQTVDRILDSFPAGQQAQIRTMLSESLRGIISQQLVPAADLEGRALACEVLICNLAVANMVRERKTFQLNSVLQTGRNIGMQRMDDALFDLMQAGRITAETAVLYAHDAKALEARVKSRGSSEPVARAR